MGLLDRLQRQLRSPYAKFLILIVFVVFVEIMIFSAVNSASSDESKFGNLGSSPSPLPLPSPLLSSEYLFKETPSFRSSSLSKPNNSASLQTATTTEASTTLLLDDIASSNLLFNPSFRTTPGRAVPFAWPRYLYYERQGVVRVQRPLPDAPDDYTLTVSHSQSSMVTSFMHIIRFQSGTVHWDIYLSFFFFF